MTPASRTVHIGGVSKADLLRRLESRGIKLNSAAEQLFADDRFVVEERTSRVEVIELTVSDLGFASGATMAMIWEAAFVRSLALCPLEVGPHLRLQWPDQPEGHVGHAPTKNRAPPCSATVVSAPISEDDSVPKGFYLRKIEGMVWLRGYRSDATHVWSPEDRLVFRSTKSEA